MTIEKTGFVIGFECIDLVQENRATKIMEDISDGTILFKPHNLSQFKIAEKFVDLLCTYKRCKKSDTRLGILAEIIINTYNKALFLDIIKRRNFIISFFRSQILKLITAK